MSAQEAKLIASDPRTAGKGLAWSKDPSSDKWAMRALPCPLLDASGGCSIYDIRPYNCRRFGCFRPDPKTEPFEEDPNASSDGILSCLNFSERFAASRIVRRAAVALQRKAQKWALAHGWKP